MKKLPFVPMIVVFAATSCFNNIPRDPHPERTIQPSFPVEGYVASIEYCGPNNPGADPGCDDGWCCVHETMHASA